MTAFLVVLSGWILFSFFMLFCLWAIHALEDAIQACREEEEEAVEEFRAELNDHGVALFEIPDSEAAEEDLHE